MMPPNRRYVEHFHEIVSGQARGLRAGLIRTALHAASWAYRIGIGTRNLLYDRGCWRPAPIPIPIISVGNLTMGGTGKTPCVELIARHLTDLGHRVAVLSRGYGQSDGPNDEALVLEQNLPEVPHLQGADRTALVQIAVEELESEILVLDDGFQHRRLARSLDLVVIDATNPWGHGFLFPRGLMREPPSALRRAHGAILTRTDLVEREIIEAIRRRINRAAPSIPLFESVHAPKRLIHTDGSNKSLSEFPRVFAAFCGIGNPSAFRRSIEQLGQAPTLWQSFPDHHSYTRQDVSALQEWARSGSGEGIVLTTQKDLVKLRLPTLGGRPLWALQVGLEITNGGDRLRQMLEDVAK